jgi:hypothetical protein
MLWLTHSHSIQIKLSVSPIPNVTTSKTYEPGTEKKDGYLNIGKFAVSPFAKDQFYSTTITTLRTSRTLMLEHWNSRTLGQSFCLHLKKRTLKFSRYLAKISDINKMRPHFLKTSGNSPVLKIKEHLPCKWYQYLALS